MQTQMRTRSGTQTKKQTRTRSGARTKERQDNVSEILGRRRRAKTEGERTTEGCRESGLGSSGRGVAKKLGFGLHNLGFGVKGLRGGFSSPTPWDGTLFSGRHPAGRNATPRPGHRERERDFHRKRKSSLNAHAEVKKPMSAPRRNRRSHGWWRRCGKMENLEMQNLVWEKGVSASENAESTAENDGYDEKPEVDRKMEALQSIVPGGKSLGVDELFEATAGYIMAL